MTNHEVSKAIHSALVTGASGLLGNNLVRLLVSRAVQVKALVRSREKAEKQLAGLPLEIVVGEMAKVEGFAEQLRGVARPERNPKQELLGRLAGRKRNGAHKLRSSACKEVGQQGPARYEGEKGRHGRTANIVS